VNRTRVRFTYHGVARVVEPWTLAYRRGAWYLVAFDTTRGERRLFKVTRIEGVPARVGRPGAYAIPDADPADGLAALEPAPATEEALVAIRDAAAPDLRRRATRVDPDTAPLAAAPPPSGFVLYRLPYAEYRDAAGELAAHGADVLVLAPAALRDAVVAHLRAVAGPGEGAA